MSKMTKEALFFLTWFENEYPEFINQYGMLRNFYDSDSDSFLIEEIQDAYIEHKNGDEPMKLYFGWSWDVKNRGTL